MAAVDLGFGREPEAARLPSSPEAGYHRAESMAEAVGENLYHLQRGLMVEGPEGRQALPTEDLRTYHANALEAAAALYLTIKQAGELQGFGGPDLQPTDDTATEVAKVRTAMLSDIAASMKMIGELVPTLPTDVEADLPNTLEDLVRTLETDVVMYQAAPEMDLDTDGRG